jgi:hypothetical protein
MISRISDLTVNETEAEFLFYDIQGLAQPKPKTEAF